MRRPYPFTLLLIVLVCGPLSGQTELQSPSEFLGYPLGTRFTLHHEMLGYFQYLSQKASAQVHVDTIGFTYEGRPLIVATLSHEQNMLELERIREMHLQSLDDLGDSGKVIVGLSYNVHGNESVGMEAAMFTAYQLLGEKKALLKDLIIRIDPCVNPDGRDRYAHWYRQFRNRRLQPDSNSKEHWEDWPGGRTNHYLFDLNRDWAWLTQTESVDRVREYRRWMPHIHVDFHEQGINSPYYFAPAAEPYHEVISDFQRSFQEEIGNNHALLFDKSGWLYFTGERFDLLYPGYGDTYPMFNGSIGMTYEQGGGGRAGLAITIDGGDTLTLDDRILHHYTTGISTLEVAARNVPRINNEFRKYFRESPEDHTAYILSGHPDKMEGLGRMLAAHGIEVYRAGGKTGRGLSYQDRSMENFRLDQNSWIVPTAQPRGRLAKVLLEPKTHVADSITYDITSWSLPYAHGLDAWAFKGRPALGKRLSTEELTGWSREFRRLEREPFKLGYIADWKTFKDARWLTALLTEGIRLRRSSERIVNPAGEFGPGSVIYLESDQQIPNAREKYLEISERFDQSVSVLPRGKSTTGPDMGSGSISLIDTPEIAVLSGNPTEAYSFGEVWHFLEQQLDYPLSVLDAAYFDRVDWERYDVLILPEGNYRTFLNGNRLKGLVDWVRSGGRLIALGSALKHLETERSFGLQLKDNPSVARVDTLPYGLNERSAISYQITGALFELEIDPTHPLAFGYEDRYVALRLSADSFEALGSEQVAVLSDNPEPLTGFAGSVAREGLGGSISIGLQRLGGGRIVYFADNPLFRGFWENGKLFIANALFGNY